MSATPLDSVKLYFIMDCADYFLRRVWVGVALPWEPNMYIPQESVVHINCTTESSQNPTWTIQLPGRTATLQFTFEASIITLNHHGFYQLPEIEVGMNMKTLQLLINSTMRKNGTVVRCDDTGTGNLIDQTILLVQEPTPVDMYSEDIDIQRTNISWNFPSLPVSLSTEDVNQTDTLTVTSSNTAQPQKLELQQPYYVFTAPEGAPPCEVYNLSITTTYDIVGANYTIAGCSVPSLVVSRMLPSLPDIGRINFSYTLVVLADEIKLNASFESGMFCEDYPVLSYTLEVQSSSSNVNTHSIVPWRFNLIANLSENRVYNLRLFASNAVGTVSSSRRQFYTTDVQSVTTYNDESRDVVTVTVQCDFIPGSDALGCMVVLIGESENTTFNLTKVSNSTCTLETIELPMNTIIDVLGYDIENDGSIGTLAIPGILNGSQSMVCVQPSVVPSGTDSNSQQSLIIGIVVAAVIIIAAVIILALILICFKDKRFKSNTSGDSSSHDGLAMMASQRNFPEEEDTSQAHYAEPLKSLQEQKTTVRTPGDGADKLSCKHGDENCTKIAEEHIYHVLENQRDCLKLESVQPPIYQDVTEISTSLKREAVVKNEYACVN